VLPGEMAPGKKRSRRASTSEGGGAEAEGEPEAEPQGAVESPRGAGGLGGPRGLPLRSQMTASIKVGKGSRVGARGGRQEGKGVG